MPQYIVIETWPDPESAFAVVDPDSGKTLVFKTRDEAQTEADQCQDGKVIKV